MEHYNMKISKKELEQNIKCIKIINEVKKLQIFEALVILKQSHQLINKLKNQRYMKVQREIKKKQLAHDPWIL